MVQKMHNFYEQHCLRWGVWGSKYLTSEFFENILENKEIYCFLVHQEMILKVRLQCQCV